MIYLNLLSVDIKELCCCRLHLHIGLKWRINWVTVNMLFIITIICSVSKCKCWNHRKIHFLEFFSRNIITFVYFDFNTCFKVIYGICIYRCNKSWLICLSSADWVEWYIVVFRHTVLVLVYKIGEMISNDYINIFC